MFLSISLHQNRILNKSYNTGDNRKIWEEYVSEQKYSKRIQRWEAQLLGYRSVICINVR